ncbi:serine protease [Acidobacteria bacterium AH-259-L09]|nr:serine protease [Acidobacteria bacterium AH-259-L09]
MKKQAQISTICATLAIYLSIPGLLMAEAVASETSSQEALQEKRSMAITDLVALVAPVSIRRRGKQIASASGFFYSRAEDLFFVTNRHVVIKEGKNFYPDELSLRLHTDPNNIRKNDNLTVPLYKNRKPLWLEHPKHGPKVDVVAIPIPRERTQKRFFIRAFSAQNHIPNDVVVSIGEDVLVLGFPLGFHDLVHNLPIVRNATLASVYPVPFQGQPFVLIDSRLHSGTSGSPVITKETAILRKTDGSTALLSGGGATFFLGVHSASIDVINRDPTQDEPLGLNVVWFASLVEEIVSGLREPH